MSEHTIGHLNCSACGQEKALLQSELQHLTAHNRDLLAALEAALPYLPSCKEGSKKGEDCGPRFPYKQRCPYMKARAVIAAAKETK